MEEATKTMVELREEIKELKSTIITLEDEIEEMNELSECYD